jgi:cytoskeletal protein CcmA (bactofilin family)
MALFGKDRERSDRVRGFGPDNVVPTAGPIAGEAEMYEQKTPSRIDEASSGAFLGKGTKVTGKLSFEGPVRIEGQVEGEISAQDTLTIGESAVVNAQITGSAIVIHGRVTGDVTAKKRLEIRAPGKLYGNISAPSLVIHEGVIFEGHCTMGGDPARAEKTPRVAIFSKEERTAAEPPVLKQVHSELGK